MSALKIYKAKPDDFDEHLAFGWFIYDEIHNLPLMAGAGEALEQMLKQ